MLGTRGGALNTPPPVVVRSRQAQALIFHDNFCARDDGAAGIGDYTRDSAEAGRDLAEH